MKWITLDDKMQELGFTVISTHNEYFRDYGKNKMLVVERKKIVKTMTVLSEKEEYTIHEFEFYSCEFVQGKMQSRKIYVNTTDVRTLLLRVKRHLYFLLSKNIIDKI
ncbi:hypothetical protein [Isobaculum melis]|uniref:Uncharacterized protein n=1 Tax=Isobaculum melis TaxID=142588 RepID=A0A1H9TPR8_9LACT|nr:hypothetical protein [Isobaculum melis]SER99058.1 hypothetical protein SAMN04488559_11543 [Isobaculum melis]